MRRTGTRVSPGPQPGRRCRTLGPGRTLAAWLVITSLGVAMVGAVVTESETGPFRIGFSTQLFTDVNDTDAKASIKAWAETVARERGINMNPSAQLYDHTDEIVHAMRLGTVDAVSLTFDEYVVLSKQVKTSHWFLTRSGDSLFEEYILLVRADADVAELPALQGQPILLHDSARTSLAMDWLDHLVMRQGHLGMADSYFESIRKVSKVSAAVLPVFFGKAEAAVVAESSFQVLCELNPQLRVKLRTVARSRPLVPAIMCFRQDFDSPEKDRLLTALRELHLTPAGEQILTIFHSQALVLVDEGPIKTTAAFVEETRQMRLQAHARFRTLTSEASDTERDTNP